MILDTQFLTLLTDLALGGMAYRLAKKLSVVQEKQTVILDQLVKRVEHLENGHNDTRMIVVHDPPSIGFKE